MATPAAVVPTGRSGEQAVADVRTYTNEPTIPPDPTMLNLLNLGLQEVERRLNGIFIMKVFATTQMQTTIELSNDIQYIESANFSWGQDGGANASPFSPGVLVYPMTQYTQATFMDAAAGFPAVGFGPPQIFFIYEDQGQAPGQQLAPPPAPQLSLVTDTGLFLVWNETDWNKTYWYGPYSLGTVEVVTTYVDPNGQTTPSLVADIDLQAGYAVECASPPTEGDATSWNCFAGNPGGPYYLQNPAPLELGTPFIIPPPFAVTATNPPTENTTGGASGGGTLKMQLYPAAIVGQVNAYCRMRPLLWADATSASYTNLDTSVQEAAVLFAVRRVLANRGRSDEIAPWNNEYEALIADMKESINRRTRPPSGQVRDVYNRGFPSSPWFISGYGN